MRNLVVISAALALAACSSTPVTRSQSQPASATQVLAPELQAASPDRSVPVFLLRDGGFMGSFFGAIVVIDGLNAVALKPGQRFDFFLAPGNHVFSVRPALAPASTPMAATTIDIQSGGPRSINLRLVSADGPRLTWSLEAQE